MSHLEPGERWGDYTVIKQLPSGAVSRNLKLRSPDGYICHGVVHRVVPPDPNAIVRQLRELQKLRHPCLAEVLHAVRHERP